MLKKPPFNARATASEANIIGVIASIRLMKSVNMFCRPEYLAFSIRPAP